MPASSNPPGIEGLKATADLAKQIITLGSALIGGTVTFADKFRAQADGALPVPGTLLAAWLAFLLAVAFAVWTLMAVTGSLDELDRSGGSSNSSRSNLRVPGGLMLLAFLIGLALTAAAGWQILS